MAKSVTEVNADPASEGHNSGKLSAQDEEALFLHHLSKLRAQQAKADEKKAEYDAERSVLTDMFRLAKSDGFTRKELQAILDDSKSLRRDLTAEEERRAKLRAWAGLPAGTQGDMFANTPEEARDELDFHGAGYASGLRGDEGTPGEDVPPRFVQAWMRGWGEGQEKLAWGLSAAGRIVDRRADTQARPVELEPEPEAEEPELDVDAEARRLKKAGFLNTDAPEAAAA